MFNIRALNVDAESGDVTIVLRTDTTGKASASGKTTVIASTNGNASVFVKGVEHKLGVNLFRA